MKQIPLAACLLALGVAAADEPAKQPDTTPVTPTAEWTTTASGLKYRVLKAGPDQVRPRAGDRVQVHYVGRLSNGKQFDSSRDRGEPFSFVLGQGQVIQGWDEGLALMTVGSLYEFDIPFALAYGENGHPPAIPPKSNLIFGVELLRVTSSPKFLALDAQQTTTTKSGIKVQVVDAGDAKSAAPTTHDGVTLDFALWNSKGDPIASTMANDFQLGGVVADLRIGRFPMPFLTETVQLMHLGTELRVEVPAKLAFDGQAVDPKLPAHSTSVWMLKLVRINTVPLFVKPDPHKQKTTASGLQYEVVDEGTGACPTDDDRVTVDYTGWLANGQMFDSSVARGEPAVFGVGNVIAGWQEGLKLMKEGSTYRLTIPGKLAYGDNPPPGSPIGKGATLIFLVHLAKVEH